ncbi:MAG: hypothetical protein E3J35_09695 [Methanomassiliicoccales archaeon]|nr:MAG: hypothetical protein E3J35_09695 [Methanomassiliicoccales archaeon]
MMNGNEKKAVQKISHMSEYLQFGVAIVLIFGFFVLLAAHFPSDAQMAQSIFVGFIAWIGSIIGFYFGQKPVMQLTTRLEEQISETEKKKSRGIRSIDNNVVLVEEHAKVVQDNIKLQGLLDDLTKSHGEALDELAELYDQTLSEL